jgi:tetratricopeptide (TPR) repeat protein
MPTAVGIMIAGFVLLVSAGGTVFFLTKPAENQRLVEEGQHQLQLGQYAFALKTLTQAVQMKPDDPKALLSLARAYVGVDQIDKAWDCIQRAQQLGAGVVAEPQLASDLAGYYRQHGQNEKAIELLRPLAASNVPGKKGELSDLDAAWGDQALQDGNIQQAMHCWEEVKETGEGMRVAEADSRLATIYSKAAEDLLRKGQNDEALKYYAKLNIMAPTAVSYQRTAEIYEKEHKLELAIDQMRKAVQIAPEPALANQKLASLMAARGKELLDSGDSNAGYGYLQQAQGIDPHVAAPSATIRNVHLGIEDGSPHFTADVWNPGPASVNSLTVKTELFDTAGGRSLWSKDFRIIDDFVPPLAAKDSRPLDVVATATIADPGSTEMRVYINGTLYNSYPFAKSASGSHAGDHGTGQPILRPRITPTTADTMPPVAPSKVKEQDTAPPIAPDASTKEPTATAGESPEEKTLKDLQ